MEAITIKMHTLRHSEKSNCNKKGMKKKNNLQSFMKK